MLILTSLTAGILGLLLVKLSFDVIGFRRKHGVSLGDGGNEDLNRAIRAHANCTEYTPIGLILIACLELNQAPIWLTLILALAFITGRCIHPIGMNNSTLSWSPRVRGMQLTLSSIAALGIVNILWGLYRFLL